MLMECLLDLIFCAVMSHGTVKALLLHCSPVTDGRVVRAGVSVTRNVGMIWRSCPNPGWVEHGCIVLLFKTQSLMALWLEQASQWHEMYCHDLKIMSSNPSRVKLGVDSTSVKVVLDPKIKLWNHCHGAVTALLKVSLKSPNIKEYTWSSGFIFSTGKVRTNAACNYWSNLKLTSQYS